MEHEKTRAEFTAFAKTVITNARIDHKRKILKTIKHEISYSDFSAIPQELLSYDEQSLCGDSSFLLGENSKHSNIERIFTNEKYYETAKAFTDREKLVLYLTVIEDKSAEEVSVIMNTTKENVWKIKSRAIKRFIQNLANNKE